MPTPANDNQKPKHTLSWGTEFLMYLLAIFFDLLGVLLGLLTFTIIGSIVTFIGGIVVSFFATLSYFVWFEVVTGGRAKGKSASKRVRNMGLTNVIEVVLGFLPAWTLFVYLSIREVKKEDAMYNKLMNKEQQAKYYRTHRAANDNQPRYHRGYKAAA